jgi:hypothetical protein
MPNMLKTEPLSQRSASNALQSRWKLWVTARTQEKAARVYARVIERMARHPDLLTIEPYPKIDGFVVTYAVPLQSREWNDAIVEVIDLGQRFAHGWCLSGAITQDPSASAHQTSVAGVSMAQWWLMTEHDEPTVED